MKRLYKNFTFLFLLGIHLMLNGQAPKVNSSSHLPLPFENVNVFTDRDLYLSGESIWISSTIHLEDTQESVSKILYVELFNANQRSIIKKKYKINQGSAEGVLDIPAEFLSDVYYLRAYTHYNKNFPVERYFISAIQIINPKKGIPAKEKNKVLNKISEKPRNTYFIRPLPPKEGMKLISVYKPQENNKNRDEVYNLDLLNYKQQVISKAKFSLSSHSALIAFPDSTLKIDGLYYYLLKDSENNIQRVHVFIHKKQSKTESDFKLTIREVKKRGSINIDLSRYLLQEHSHLGLKVALKGSILSSVDKLKLLMQDPYLLMNYLKTQFNPLSLNPREEKASLLALNQKLNQNEYKNLFDPHNVYEQRWIPGLKDIGLSGIAIDRSTQKPLPNVPIYLSLSNKRLEIHTTITEEDGGFEFLLNSFVGYKNALLCPLYKGIDEIELRVNREFIPFFQDLNPIPLTIDSNSIELIEEMLISTQIAKNQKLKSEDEDFKIQHLPYSFDDPDISIVLDNYVETPTMEMVFKELVTSVRVRKKNKAYTLSVFDTIRGLLYIKPLIMVDNIPIFDIESLLKIPPKAVEKIEVHSSPFIMESHIIYGIVNINTFTDNFGGMNMHKSSSFFKYQTYSPSYTFNRKKYNSIEELKSRSADFRTVLYWDPFIKKNSSNELQFYTSDQTGVYETYIFGTYANGQAFQSKLFDLEVKD